MIFVQALHIVSLILNAIILILIMINLSRNHKDGYNNIRLMMFLFNIMTTLHIIGLMYNMQLFAAVTIFVMTLIGFYLFIRDYL